MNVGIALSSLSGTDGVLGSVVFDRTGVCVANDLPAPYEPVLMADFVRRLLGTFDVFASLDDCGVTGLYASCERGGVLLRHVDGHTLVVLTHTDVNVNLLNVALNVAVLNLAREMNNDVSRSRASPIAFGGQSSHSMSQSGVPGEIIPPDAVGKAIVMRLLETFTEFMGPAARTVMKQQLAALGVSSRTLRHAQYVDLVHRLAARLPSTARQGQFIAAARRLHD